MDAWSYSSIKTFDQCPKKYHHLKVLKDVKDEGSDATLYGQDVHTAAEHYFLNGTPIPEKYSYMRPIMGALDKIPGTKHTELRVGVAKQGGTYTPCDFFAPDVWYRGVIDLLITRDNNAHMLDYKTGKSARYADVKQLDLMAGAVFCHFPDILKIKSALAFVVSGEFVAKTHVREEQANYLETFAPQLQRLETAHETGVWNANPSGLCGWCPVTSCEHHRPRR